MKSITYLLFIILFFYLSCEQYSTTPILVDDSDNPDGLMKITMDMTNAPSEVVRLEGKLHNDDGDEIYFDFEIDENSATALVEDIPSGNWILRVNAYDKDDILIYTGTTEIIVYPGVVTPVSLHLNPATGSLEITVTWGTDPGLVAYYPFNGNGNDESGNEHHGKVMGPILAADRFGNEKSAYYFDGIDDEIFIGYDSDLDVLGDISICVWFKTDISQWGSLVSNFDQHIPDNGYELCVGSLYENGGFIYFEFAENDVKDGFSTNNSFDDGQWHFVTVISLLRRVSIRRPGVTAAD